MPKQKAWWMKIWLELWEISYTLTGRLTVSLSQIVIYSDNDTALIYNDLNLAPNCVNAYMRITRAACSKQSKQNSSNQGKIKKSSHIQASKMFFPSILLGRISANIWTWLDRMQVKDPALNDGTIQYIPASLCSWNM